MGKASFIPRQQNWKYFANDGVEPVTELELENTKPTLADDAIIRLRLAIAETGGAGLNNGYYKLQVSDDESSWSDLAPGAEFDYADGLATEDDTVTSFKLTDTDAYGPYRESEGQTTYDISASDVTEFDFAIQPVSSVRSYDTDYYIRMLYSSDGVSYTEITLNSGETHPIVRTRTSPPAGDARSFGTIVGV